MKHHRRLRRLLPDQELIRRRAAGETLRELAVPYGVSHTTLGRYFGRPEVVKQLREARRLERREAVAGGQSRRQVGERIRSAAERQQVQEDSDRERIVPVAAPIRPRRSPYDAWLDGHDARRPVGRSGLQTGNDVRAAKAVAAGGGIQAVIEATDLRTRENVEQRIDPVILAAALENDAQGQTTRELPQESSA